MSDLYLYNTLSNRRDVFTPIHPERVWMYVCGPTVYGPVHVGNARPAVVFDLLYRLLKRRYRGVRYVRNITDIDDKIIQAAAANKEETTVLARRWQADYTENMRRLDVLPPDEEPAATDHIGSIVAMIERLLASGVAYAAEEHVLFHVPAFADYGALSNRRREDMIDGARVEVAPYKRDPADFVLWKPSPADEPGWDSPWGRGRPGWHIECSAMAASCLGEKIDIHGGGQDLIFPHHENELAQSRCAHETSLFARYWVHNGHVRMEGEKMSKSLNNVLLLQDALAQFAGETVRLALLSAHYRRPLNWTENLLIEAKSTLDRWYRAVDGDVVAKDSPPAAVENALLDDLNTPAAFAALHQIVNTISAADDERQAAAARGDLLAGASLLGLLKETPTAWFHGEAGGVQTLPQAEEIERMIAERLAARQRRDFAAADEVRDSLAARGVVLEDTPTGTTWRID